jgi:hypothetical protein
MKHITSSLLLLFSQQAFFLSYCLFCMIAWYWSRVESSGKQHQDSPPQWPTRPLSQPDLAIEENRRNALILGSSQIQILLSAKMHWALPTSYWEYSVLASFAGCNYSSLNWLQLQHRSHKAHLARSYNNKNSPRVSCTSTSTPTCTTLTSSRRSTSPPPCHQSRISKLGF